jgi:1-deoxy-D-xylulose-5-phosphate reductoisomerase
MRHFPGQDMKKICILGSTGSIGTNTLDVIASNPGYFQASIIATNRNIELISGQIAKFHPEQVIIFDKTAHETFLKINPHPSVRVGYGMSGLLAAFDHNQPDILVNALVGFAGLQPTIEALKRKIPVALANKETLVVAGAYIMQLAARYKVELMPIDSEHSAIWQCLSGEKGNKIRRIIITASGGPFRTMNINDMPAITPEQALRHPNWKMGPKITIDSATLMNKGLEVIEAFWLYHVPLEQIEVVIHPQSIIHSMVEFEDKSIKAQLGIPDMRIPIQFALSHPQRFPLDLPPMDFSLYNQLTFEKADLNRFPCLNLAYQVIRSGKSYPAVLNAANEVAVDAFLQRKIRFTDIARLIEAQLNQHQPSETADYLDYLYIDEKTRKSSLQSISAIKK